VLKWSWSIFEHNQGISFLNLSGNPELLLGNLGVKVTGTKRSNLNFMLCKVYY